MSIKNSPSFKAADKLADTDPNKTLRSVTPTTSQVGKTEVAALNLIRKIEQQDPSIEVLVASVGDGTLNTTPNQNRLALVQKALQSYRAIFNSFKARLETLKRTPNNLAQASLTLSAAGTAIKLLPIPGLTLTAGATSTFSGKLSDIRAKGRDLLDAAQTADSLLEDNDLNEVDVELRAREERLNLLLEAQKQFENLSKEQQLSIAKCLSTTTKRVPTDCLSSVNQILNPTINLFDLNPEEDLYVVDYNGVSYKVVIEIVDSPFFDYTKVYRRALAVREDGMVKCVTEVVAVEDREYFVKALRRCLLVEPFPNFGYVQERKITYIAPSLIFVASFENETELVIIHELGTNDFIVQVYQDEEGSLKQIVPESIKTYDNSRIVIRLSEPTSGVVVFNQPTATDTVVDTTTSATSKDINHDLSVELPLIQVYVDNEVILPQTIRVVDDNTIRVELSEPTDFKVVVFNPPLRNTTTINTLTTQINHSFNTIPPLVQVYYLDTTPVQIIPEKIEVLDASTIEVKLSSLSEYKATIGSATRVVPVNISTCALEIAITDVTPVP